MYLSYGENRAETINIYIENLRLVATACLKMTCHYVSIRVEKSSCACFSEDLKNNLIIDIDSSIYNVGKI